MFVLPDAYANSSFCDHDHVDRFGIVATNTPTAGGYDAWPGYRMAVQPTPLQIAWSRPQQCPRRETSAGVVMAKDVIDFQSRREAREAERAEYDAHHKRVVAIFKIMAPVVARAQELGADNQAIAGALRAIVEELEAVQSSPPDAAS